MDQSFMTDMDHKISILKDSVCQSKEKDPSTDCEGQKVRGYSHNFTVSHDFLTIGVLFSR